MAKKGRVGNAYYYGQRKIDRLIEKIDQREKSGKNRENVDKVFANHSFTKDGAKVWSF